MFEKKKKGHRSVNYVWPLAGGYLIYQGGKLLFMCVNGTAGQLWLDLIMGVFFMAIGAIVIIREWHIYNTVPIQPEETDPDKDSDDDVKPNREESHD